MSLSFNPTGFTYKRSLSNASPNFNGVETFTWNPTFHGFSGDLLCSSIIYRSAQFTGTNPNFARARAIINVTVQNGRPVMPMPIIWNDALQTPAQNIPAANMPQGAIPIGIAQKFRYTPLGTDQEVTVLNFPQNTPIQPNTLVYVDVITDPMAVFEAQTNSPFGYGPGFGSNTRFKVNGINTYQVNLISQGATLVDPNVEVTLTFVLGEFNGPTAGSRQYLFAIDATDATNSLTSVNSWLGDFSDSAYSLGLTEGIIDNEFSYQGGTIYPYLIQDVKITNTATTNGYASTGYYPGAFPAYPIPT